MTSNSFFRRLPNRICAAVALTSLFAAVPALADGVAPKEATRAQNDATERKLAEGKKLVTQGKLEEAIERFRAARDIVATPTATLMIARARRDGGELLAAHAEYLTALDEAEEAAQTDPKFETTRSTIRKELDELEGVLGKLVIKLVHAPKGTEITIDGEPVDSSKLATPILAAPGPTLVVATALDGQIVQRQTSVNAGQSTIVELGFVRETEPQAFFADDGEPKQTEEAVPPPDESSGGGNALAYVAGGIGVAGLATFTIFGLMANATYDDLEQVCPNDQCPPERRDDIDTGQQQQTIANIGLTVGIVGVGTGAALLLFGGKKAPETKPSAELTIGPGSIRVRGSF